MRRGCRALASLTFAVSLVWLAALAGAARVRSEPGAWPDPARAGAGLVYLAASAVCHQRPERSFAPAGTPLPVCARCTGLYLGAALGLGVGLVACRRSGGRRLEVGRAVLVGGALPTAVSVIAEWVGLGSTLSSRALTAVPLGLATALVVVQWLQGAGLHDGQPGAGGRSATLP